jgi:hypothetical protein
MQERGEVMWKTTAALSVLMMALVAACGGDDKDGGIVIAFGTPQAPRNLTAVAPDLPRQQTQPTAPGLPRAAASVPVPQAGTGTSSPVNACALVTRQDAANALGKPVNEGRPLDVPRQNLGAITVDLSLCSYNATDGPGQVGLETWKHSDVAQVRMVGSITCRGKEMVSGLGDSACWNSSTHQQIFVIKGGAFINLRIQNAPNEDVVKNLARSIIARV